MYGWVSPTKALPDDWVWVNGVNLDTTYWSRSYKMNGFSSRYTPDQYTADCALIRDGLLYDEHCLVTDKFVCERTDLL